MYYMLQNLCRLSMLVLIISCLPPTPYQNHSPVQTPTPSSLPASGTALSKERAKELFSKLPPLPTPPSQEQVVLPKTTPPPKPSRPVQTVFFSKELTNKAKPASKTEFLEILRYTPEGEVSLAPDLSISFSQPMVSLGAPGEAAKNVPVVLSPETPGQWRWLGTRLLKFFPEKRFSFATEYTVEIPAGTASASGNQLQTTRRFQFATSAPKVTKFFPDSRAPVPFTPTLFLAFDQHVEADKILQYIKVSAKNFTSAVRLATKEELAEETTYQEWSKEFSENTWLALRVVETLPEDSKITVTIEAGTPSAEGPRVTEKDQMFHFETYGPFKIRKTDCSERKKCDPYRGFNVRFSNPIDTESFDASLIKVEPALDNFSVDVYSQSLYISGTSKPNTKYKITFDSQIRSLFGQTLKKERTRNFYIGPVSPSLYSFGKDFLVLHSEEGTYLPVFSTNIKRANVKVYQVIPEDFSKYLEYRRKKTDGKKTSLPGKLILSQNIQLSEKTGETTNTPIDLSKILPKGIGQVIVFVEPTKFWVSAKKVDPIETWVQFTNIALDAYVDQGELTAWVTSLREGTPLSGVDVSLYPSKSSQKTEKNGLATVKLSQKQDDILIARLGDDVAILPRRLHTSRDAWETEDSLEEQEEWFPDASRWQAQPSKIVLKWYLASDRKLYRPGETAWFKGWIRKIDLGEGGDVELLGQDSFQLSCKATNPNGQTIASKILQLNNLGGFDFSLKIPEETPLGYTKISCLADTNFWGKEESITIQVREFRTPEFEVKTQAGEGPFFVENAVKAFVSASYYTGEPLPNAPVSWETYFSLAEFTPPNRQTYFFGLAFLWNYTGYENEKTPQKPMISGSTSQEGKHINTISLPKTKIPQPYIVDIDSTVQDLNRQAWASTTSILVHPASLYVGLKKDRKNNEDPLAIEAIVVDLEGNLIAGKPIRIKSEHLESFWNNKTNKQETKILDTQTCETESTQSTSGCKFTSKGNGLYLITATITDDAGRENISQMTLWVYDTYSFSSKGDESEYQLIADQEEYQPGDTARLLLISPLYPAEALVSVRRGGILSTEHISVTNKKTHIEIPIKEDFLPNVFVNVNLVERQEWNEEAPEFPETHSLELALSVPPKDRRLSLSVEPKQKVLRPGGKTELSVFLTDAKSRPVKNAEVSIVVVDEAILALAGDYRLPDPLPGFYPEREPGSAEYYLRDYAYIASPFSLYGTGSGGGGSGYGAGRGLLGGSASPVALRGNFSPLALFVGSVLTDQEGKATVPITLPDNLTRYRIMAVSAAGNGQFGRTESTMTAKLPLMARPSPPRFLRMGDTFSLPVLLQNQTPNEMALDVAIRGVGVTLSGANGYHIKIPPYDRKEVLFSAKAEHAGEATFQVIAVSGKYSDAATFSFPVYTPTAKETFAVYGHIDKDAIVQPIAPPEHALKQYGGIELTTSSTALSGLSDAILYLTQYPYECSEQISSRIVAITTIYDVLDALQTKELPEKALLKKTVEQDIQTLKKRQNTKGVFGLWKKNGHSWPYLNIHVTHALVRAKNHGFSVPQEMLDSAKTYLQNIQRHMGTEYSDTARMTMLAYALYIRNLLEEPEPASAQKIWKQHKKQALSLETMALLLPVLSQNTRFSKDVIAIKKQLLSSVNETSDIAFFRNSYKEEENHILLASNRRTDAMILDALLLVEPTHELIPKLVAGLLKHRVRGRWNTTQENAFVLVALQHYFSVFEKDSSDILAQIWLDDFYQEANFQKNDLEAKIFTQPLEKLFTNSEITLAKQGKGRLYYRLALQYVQTGNSLEEADFGFIVERSYEAIDNPEDVWRAEDGVWHIKAGARVRVHLTMVAKSQRYHVALVDSLPGGLEAQDASLSTTVKSSFAGSIKLWYQHYQVRNDRVEIFTTSLPAGVYPFSYVARATTPGNFSVPPTKAEEMYSPETFGRSFSERVIIE